FIVEVSEPDEKGFMSYGPIGTFNGDVAAKFAKTVIAQVNRQTPYVFGGPKSFIHVNDVTLICESDHKVGELQQPPVTDVEKQIASHIVGNIEDGSTIQLGLGGVANAVGFFLENHKNMGVHT
ncbi:MAG: 4-hydroxybutyrate CoA-transferase, partial [Deltaproteobacteria bacterium]|nr:4-hydroxybutyrate CoA-transferase [Deltaproteobacteria bacterium]